MRKYIKQIISRLQDNYMTKNYYSAIATICLVLLLSITCISKSYAHNNDSITTKVEVKNEAKNDFEINKLLTIAISCAIWIIGYNFLSSKALLKKSLNEKKSLKKENSQLQLTNELQQIKQEHERKIAQLKLKQLRREIKHKKALLLQNITEHIHLAKRIQQHKNTEKAPQWLETYLSKYSYSSAKNWNRFLAEFEGVFPNFLQFIRESHPELTESDIQYIILTILGLDNNDISFVLSKTTRTIWNRRDTIKTRLDLKETSIEEWLDSLMSSYERKHRELLEKEKESIMN